MKRLLFVLNLVCYLLYPNLLWGIDQKKPDKVIIGSKTDVYTDGTCYLEVYILEGDIKTIKLQATNISEDKAEKLSKEWRKKLAWYYSQTVPYQALLKKK